jgi:surfeit locus 1 family protein
LSIALRRPRLRGLAFLVVAASAISLGLWLGLWQLQRHAGKQALIAMISARATAAPQAVPELSEWPRLRPLDYEYRHVSVEGTFAHDKEVLVFRASGGATTGQDHDGSGSQRSEIIIGSDSKNSARDTSGKPVPASPRAVLDEPGYLVLTPLKLATGGVIVVNRGFVPLSSLGSIARDDPEHPGLTRVTGLLRAPEARNLFTPRDDLAHGRAFTRDPVAIVAHFGLEPAAPFSIDADAGPDPRGWPRSGTTELQIPDNHLGYALTWFGLAATGVMVLAAYAWTRRHGPA